MSDAGSLSIPILNFPELRKIPKFLNSTVSETVQVLEKGASTYSSFQQKAVESSSQICYLSMKRSAAGFFGGLGDGVITYLDRLKQTRCDGAKLMTGRGRFGKYGDLKRKEKIRQANWLRSGQTGSLSALERPGLLGKSGKGGFRKARRSLVAPCQGADKKDAT
jgi:light-regulated signal transduction histidine kinase (bacteriophytochrome)